MIAVFAALAGVHSTREPLPSRTAERPLVLPKGWSELTLTAGYESARLGWTHQGTATDLGLRWTRWQTRAHLRMGLAPGVEISAALPFVVSQAHVTQVGFGTAEIGARVGHSGVAPSRSWAISLRGRLPLGYAGGSLEDGRIPLSTGTADLVLGAHGRIAWSGLIADASIEGWQRFGGSPGWIRSGRTDARFRPGLAAVARGSVRLQAGPLVFGPVGRARWRDTVHIDGERQAATGGFSFEGGARVDLEVTRGVLLYVHGSHALWGQGGAYSLLPDVDPAQTRRLDAGITIRW